MEFNKIVKKLSRLTKSVLDLEDVAEFVDPEFSKGLEGKRAAYKLAYRLRSEGILKPIRNGLYLLEKPGSAMANPKKNAELEDVRAIEDAYWKIVKKLISKNCASEYVLAGLKSLEIRMRDLSIPDTLIVYTRNYDASVVVSSRHKVVFKTAKSGSKMGRANAYPVFSKFAETVEIDGVKFKIAGIEQAVLDSLIVHKGMPDIDVRTVEKFLSKYSKALRREVLWELVTFKYLTAVNRLREISRDRGDVTTYEKALDVVKREGGNCFVTWKSA